MDLSKSKLRVLTVLITPLLLFSFASPVVAASPIAKPAAVTLHISTVGPNVQLLDPSFNPNSPVGGVPFCSSGSLGTILCYPQSFLKTAYNFPSTSGFGGLDGRGSTIVIVDAYGSPTIQSDLNTFDSTFGLPSATITILCGPTWTGSATDNCPVKTPADFATAPNADVCGPVGWAEETSLDVTQAHALAPAAKIVLVVANDCYDDSLYGAEQAVVSQHKYDGSIMSQSFGEPDDLVTCTALDPTNSYCVANDPSFLNLPNSVFQMATDRHWTVIASSGDDGANEAIRYTGNPELVPAFPSTSPLVLAAGGTQGNPYGGQYGAPPGPGVTWSCGAFRLCNTGLVFISGGLHGCGTSVRPGEPSGCFPLLYGGESAWNEFNNFGIATSTGGGISTLYDRPSYQSGTPSKVTTLFGETVKVTGRTVPDVSFNSAIHGGVLVYLGFLGAWGVFGGTSAASPAWAGIVALLNQANGKPAGFINSAIYSMAANTPSFFGFSLFGPFHDVTSGENSDTAGQYGVDGFASTRGYDLTTGWGTPNVSAFIQGIQHYLHS